MNICSTLLKLKKCLTYVTLTEIFETECNLQHFTRNCRFKNLDDFKRDEVDRYLCRAGLLNLKGKGMTICYVINRCLVIFLRGGKVRVVEY